MKDDIEQVKDAVASIPWFSKLHPSCIDHLTEIASLGEIKAGERLFSEGDPPDYLYILVSGRLAVELHIPTRGRMRLETIEEHEIFGWSGVTERARQRTATAVAVKDSQFIRFPSKKLMGLISKDPQLGYCVFNRVANTIADRLQVTRLQLLDIFATPEEAN
jgi:CRP-like cAMP-binding protein